MNPTSHFCGSPAILAIVSPSPKCQLKTGLEKANYVVLRNQQPNKGRDK